MTVIRPIAVVGPTATGKSDLALDLAERLDGEIVNIDAMQMYRGMDIGTAKLPVGERRGIPHHLFDALEVTDDVVVINSFSKFFSMTGWRIGWMVVPESLARPVECLAQNLFISAPQLSQVAALAAFDATAELEAIKAGYARNRQVLLEGLPQAGFDRLLPVDGAFYVYADIGHMTNDSLDFARRMLAEAGVAATPGPDFDPYGGMRAIRFSFAGSTADMEEAMRRLAAWSK